MMNYTMSKEGHKMIYQIQDNAYEMPRNQYKQVIKMLKSKHKKMNIILAVEKSGKAIALRSIFETRKELLEAVKDYRVDGYEVSYNMGK